MTFFPNNSNRKKPKPVSTKWVRLEQPEDKVKRERKPMRRVGKKTEWWQFCSVVWNRFFEVIELPRRCEVCDGSAYCGPLTPAHSRRRQDIRVGDYWFAFRIACLGSACHLDIDSKGRRDAEPIIEAIISERFDRLGLSESDVKTILLRCAETVQEENPKWQSFEVSFD